MIGETLSHYEIVDKIGAGGMGEVYRARDPRLGRDVAIKVLPSYLTRDAERLARFEQEARAAGTLNHPNVLAIHDVGNDRGVPFLVTELLEGETLRKRIDSGSLTRRKAVEYAAQIADGLAAAHGHNVVHRDLKPDNVFISRDGHVKILDFGLAKLTEPDPDNPLSTESPTEALTRTNVVVGTPGYLSPEQLHGEPADSRSDIFAFGVILYEMISGRRPFAGDTFAEISAASMRDDPAPLSGLHRPVPPTLDRMVRQCLEKNPDERFESAHDLAHMLRAVSDTEETPTAAVPRATNRQWLRPAAAVAGIAVAAVVGWELVDLQPAPAIPSVKHVAVLPFEAADDDPESRFLAAGLAETVADGLTIMERETRGAVWVVPPSPELTLEKAHTLHNATIGVRGVVSPGVERMRLEFELLDAASGRTLARRTLDESTRNLTGLQKEPVHMVWEMLGFEATPAALEDLGNLSTNTVTACRAYVSGRGRLSTAGDDAELLAAVASLERAVDDDPGYAPARVALARAFARLYEETGDERWKERAVAEAEYVIGLDGDAAEPYLVLGVVQGIAGESELQLEAYRRAAARAETAAPFYVFGRAATETGDFEEAERALQTAINLRPDCFHGHNALAYLYCKMNRLDAAVNQFRQAARAAPENPEAHVNLGTALYFQDRREEAKEAFEEALALGPNPTAYSNLGGLYFEEARFGDAAEMFERAVELAGDDIPADQYYLVGNMAAALYWGGEKERAAEGYRDAIRMAEAYLEKGGDDELAMANLAGYYAMTGQRDRGLVLLGTVNLEEVREPAVMGTIAESYEDLGDRDQAVEWIEIALESGLAVDWIERRPALNSLREDDRYKALVKAAVNRD